MLHSFYLIVSKIERPHTWLLLAFLMYSSSTYAQGQGSYGGIAGGLFQGFLIMVLIGVVIGLLVIWRIFGYKVALVALAIIVVWLIKFIHDARQSEATRLMAYAKIERAFAEGCADATRVIEHPAKGNERVYLRLHGADKIPSWQARYLLPSATVAEGVAVVSELPPDASNAIVVDIHYNRELLPGSYPGYEWHRTRYELEVRTVPKGRLIARTNDLEARNGFCLGDLEVFLQRSLNRPAVFNKVSYSGTMRPALPDAYVLANYTEATPGVYLKSAKFRNPLDNVKEVLKSKGCGIKESNISPSMALCGDPSRDPVQVPLSDIVGIHQLPSAWLLVYRVFKGTNPLTSMRIEQRRSDWTLARVWSVNAAPAPGNSEGQERLDEFALRGEELTAVAYWGFRYDSVLKSREYLYTKKSVLTVPLPGLIP